MEGMASDIAAQSDDELRGLTSDEVGARVSQGLTNHVEDKTSRSLASILKENILTRFNAIIGAMLVLVLIFGELPDALFGIVLVVNAIIGIVQELRAKLTLDRLTLMTIPRTEVIRDAESAEIPDSDLVLDDVLVVGQGDQLGVDCAVLSATGLQLDESLLTGEAEPVEKQRGDELLSGSFVVAGAGYAQAIKVGEDAFARQIASAAKQFHPARSDLRAGIDTILKYITWLIVPIGVVLFASQLRDGDSISDGVSSAVAGVVAMVPEGLVLLTSLAMAIAVIRLGAKNVVVQEMPAVETLARVDVVCLDKTGTLTEGRIAFDRADAIDGTGLPERNDEIRAALAALGASEPNPNPSLRAISEAFAGDPGWTPTGVIPFSSARKFSSVTFENEGTWILGAPEIVLTPHDPASAQDAAAEAAAGGNRVLALSHSDTRPVDERLPDSRRGVALVTLAERVRPEAPDTIRYFCDQGVTPKVISGDNPNTVAAIATKAAVPNATSAVDARDLPDDPDALADSLDTNAVFGRVSPKQKQAMVGALQSRDHTVAMTGDGVNDVLALKSADIGIGMGAGTDATKAVAQLVLLDNDFAVLPSVVAEGRRIIANMERVAALFLTKTVYATLLALLVGVLEIPFPFLPRHLTLVGSLTIGIPAFVLSFAPSKRRAQPGFLHRVMRFALPAGLVAGLATFAAYATSGLLLEAPLEQARTAATITLLLIGLWILIMLSRPLNWWKTALFLAMLVGVVLALAIPFVREFFELVVPPFDEWLIIILIVLAAITILEGLRILLARWKVLGSE